MTYGELLQIVPATKGMKIPSAKEAVLNAEIVIQDTFLGDELITVYSNGWVTYCKDERTMVYGVDYREQMDYAFCVQDMTLPKLEDMLHVSWIIPVSHFGELKFQQSKPRMIREQDMTLNLHASMPDYLRDTIQEIDEACYHEMRSLIHEALEALPDKMKAIVKVHYAIDQQSIRQTSKITGRSFSTVYEALEKARIRIRSDCEEEVNQLIKERESVWFC